MYIHGVLNTPYTSKPGQSVAATVEGFGDEHKGNEYMLGVWIGGFAMTIGQNREGLLNITDVDPIEQPTPVLKYSVIAQTQWILVLKFEDA